MSLEVLGHVRGALLALRNDERFTALSGDSLLAQAFTADHATTRDLLLFLCLAVGEVQQSNLNIERKLAAMAETLQQQHDNILSSLNTVNTNLKTFNTTAVDLAAEVAALKAANPTVDFTDAETLAAGLVSQSNTMIQNTPDPGAQSSGSTAPAGS